MTYITQHTPFAGATAVKILDGGTPSPGTTGSSSPPIPGMADDEICRIGGYLVVWGDEERRDLHGEFFTPGTELALDWYTHRPVLYHHGLDGAVKSALVGAIDTLRVDEIGVWAEAQLDLRQRYVRAVRDLIARGILAWSSGSLPHLVEVEAGGRIKRWPIIEGSLTPTPAEPRRTTVQAVKSAYEALGLAVEPLREQQSNEQPYLKEAGKQMNREDIMAAINTALDERENTPTGPVKRLPTGDPADLDTPAVKKAPKITVSSPYDNLDALDMAHGYVLLRSLKSFRGVSQPFANALAHKVRRSGMSALKSDELSYSTQTGYGDEWVPDLWSAELWRQARLENVILPLLRAVEMPSNPYELPVEGADPTVYYVSETANETDLSLGSGNPIPDSKVGSGKVTLNAKKLALRVGFSAELAEDSIVPILNMYREQAMRALSNAIDSVILNGDTESGATGNINSDDGAPSGSEPYQAFDGLRKLPLVTTTANGISAAAAPSLALMRQARFAMAHKYSVNPSQLAWVFDGGSYAKLLALDEFLTMDKAGPHATALTGQIGFVDGIPVVVTAEMPLTMAEANDTLGHN